MFANYYYLLGKEMHRERDRELSCLGSFPKHPQQPALGEAQNQQEDCNPGLPHERQELIPLSHHRCSQRLHQWETTGNHSWESNLGSPMQDFGTLTTRLNDCKKKV